MTPKEKAIELYEKFYKLYPNQDAQFIAAECALIAVDETIEELSKWTGGDFIGWEKERWKYLQEVKQEINLL